MTSSLTRSDGRSSSGFDDNKFRSNSVASSIKDDKNDKNEGHSQHASSAKKMEKNRKNLNGSKSPSNFETQKEVYKLR